MCVFLHITKRGKCVCVKDSHLLEHIPHIFRPSAQLAPVYLCVIFSQSWQLWPPFISGFKAHVIYHYRLRCCSLIIALNESPCRNSPQSRLFSGHINLPLTSCTLMVSYISQHADSCAFCCVNLWHVSCRHEAVRLLF